MFLVRHAEAAPGEPDELRRLTPHGRDQARELGRRLVRDGVRADVVLSSPLVRARETAEAIAKEPKRCATPSAAAARRSSRSGISPTAAESPPR